MSVLVQSEKANTKKVTPCRNRNVFSSLFRTDKEYSHTRGWVSGFWNICLQSWTGHQTQGNPSRTHCLGGLLLCGVLKVSWCRAGHYRSAWDLKLQEALGSCSQGSHKPDARLYPLATLQQFSKNACNSKYFSLDRSVFADLGITGTFPDSSTPISSIYPEYLDGATPLTHRYTQDKENMLEWDYYPKLQGPKKWM